ncbi:InlB B-repeat-containing protein [Natranaerobius trueperi]|uniref:Bacterial repeat domain-containing protein n=1 Tax=Natranaerobius trueperi TaxID=759412 RepID=A0A226C1N3_9FIRM|nr:hypothetical protein [Natranaerobius trueperi]OWZ84349.1 hypothetical protein CDO51_03545 [Natranaerobius trueperi]
MAKLLYLSCIFLIFFVGCGLDNEVNIEKSDVDAGEIKGEGRFQEGEKVTVTAKPYDGYEFKYWKKDDTKISEEKDYEFKVKEDVNLTAKFEDNSQVIKGSFEIFSEAYLTGYFQKARKYVTSEVDFVSSRDDLLDKINPNKIIASDDIKSEIINLYIENIDYNIEIITLEDQKAKLELDIKYPTIDELEQKYKDNLKPKKIVEDNCSKWKEKITETLKKTSRKSYVTEVEMVFEDDLWKITKNPLPEKIYPKNLEKTISLTSDFINQKEYLDKQIKLIEDSLKEANLDKFLPLSDNLKLFKQKQNMLIRDLDFVKKESVRSPSINEINIIKLDGQLIELENAIRIDEKSPLFNKTKNDIKVSVNGEIITTIKQIMDAWNNYFHNDIEKERREGLLNYYQDSIKKDGELSKLAIQDNILAFDLLWGGCVNKSGALGYIDLETNEINISNYFNGFLGTKENRISNWSPCGNYHIYIVNCPGKGDSKLKVTDLNDYSNIEITHPEELFGEFKDFEWSKEGDKLEFKVIDNNNESFLWELDIEDKQLNPLNID